MLRPRTLLLVAWVWGAGLWLLISSHRSGSPVVLDRWSRGLAAALALGAGALLFGLGALGLVFVRPRWERRLETALHSLRRKRWLLGLLALAPVLAWLIALAWLANTDLPFMVRAWAGFAMLTGLTATWLALLLFADASAAVQSRLLARVLVLAISTLLAVAAFEVAGRAVLGRASGGHLNPPGLDRPFVTDEFQTHVVTNRQGLRENEETPPKTASETRVLFVGDSVVFGWGVEGEQSLPAACEGLWNDQTKAPSGGGPRKTVRTINAGKPGSALPDYLRVMRYDAPAWEADWIVLGFLIGNDCPVSPPVSLANEEAVQRAVQRWRRELSRETQWAGLRRSLFLSAIHRSTQRALGAARGASSSSKAGPLFGEPNPLDGERLEAEVRSSGKEQLLRARIEDLESDGWMEKGRQWRINPWLLRSAILDQDGVLCALGEQPAKRTLLRNEWGLCEALLDEAVRLANLQQARLCILALPSPYQVSPRCRQFLRDLGCDAPESLSRAKTINRWLSEYCRRRKLLLVDPLDDFLASEDPDRLFFPQDGHPTPSGHALIAQRLATELAPSREFHDDR